MHVMTPKRLPQKLRRVLIYEVVSYLSFLSSSQAVLLFLAYEDLFVSLLYSQKRQFGMKKENRRGRIGKQGC
jgi:hypothetical protein